MNMTTPTVTEEPKTKKTPTYGTGFIPFQDTGNVKSILTHAITKNIPALLVGETGTGKTTCLRDIAKRKKKELIRVSVNGATSVEEIVGKWILKDSETVWINGVLTDAMMKGHWIVFDEINAALPEVLFTLHSVLDDDRKLLVAEKDGEIIRPHDDFRFFATMNPSVGYAGTKEMNTALLSRFGVVVYMQHLSPAREQKLLQEHGGIEEAQAGLLTHTGVLFRKAWEQENIATFVSTRDLLQAANILHSGLDLSKAIEYAIINKGTSVEERNDMRKVIAEVISMGKENRTVTYANTIELSEKIKALVIKALEVERDKSIYEAMYSAEKEKFGLMKSERDILLGILMKYLKPFLQALRDKAKANAEDTERTEESRRDWKSLQDKIEDRIKEIEEGEKTVEDYDQRISDIEKRTVQRREELAERFNTQAEEMKTKPAETFTEGVERESEKEAYDAELQS